MANKRQNQIYFMCQNLWPDFGIKTRLTHCYPKIQSKNQNRKSFPGSICP